MDQTHLLDVEYFAESFEALAVQRILRCSRQEFIKHLYLNRTTQITLLISTLYPHCISKPELIYRFFSQNSTIIISGESSGDMPSCARAGEAHVIM